MLQKKIMFVGAGNMAEGLIRGIINNNVLPAKNITAYDILEERLDFLTKTYGISISTNLSTTITDADIVFVAVRPQDAENVMRDLKPLLVNDPLIISICAGIDLAQMTTLLGADKKLFRVMPNVLIEARCGYSGVSINGNVAKTDKDIVENLLTAIGKTLFIDESNFDAFTAFSCAGPAYIFHFLYALVDAGVQSGFSRKDSLNIVLDNMIGSAQMIQLTGKHPTQISDVMTSPAGVTIEGLHVLHEAGVHGIVMSCVKSALQKTKEFK